MCKLALRELLEVYNVGKFPQWFSDINFGHSETSLFAYFFILSTSPAAAKSLQSCLTLCNRIDNSPPDFSVPGILQERIVEWVVTSFSNQCMHTKSLQSCPTLCDSVDSSPPGSSIPGILQARTLEWVAISFSNASLHTKSLQSCLTLCDPMDSSPPGSSVHGILQEEYWSGLPFPSPFNY